MTSFKNLHLNEKIIAALEKKGYTHPTPIQLQAIPHVLAKKDLLGIAQTGTGKTAAFALPILDLLSKTPYQVKAGQFRTLILTPTRELASQIAENIEVYGKELGLKSIVIFGGVSEQPQIRAMAKGVDIVIATPGRLLDLANQGYVRFSQIEIFVLDEADRMLDMGFIHDIKKIIAKLPQERQTLFFSATMPTTIAHLAHSILKNPVKVEVTPQSTTVEKIDQKIYQVAKGNKPSLLKSILKNEEVKSMLVFSQTKHGANKVVEHLEKHGISVAAIHGNKSQGAREKALKGFREGTFKVLIATDIAARGIDVPAISHVINYDIPQDPENYVHRIGRTARAGREGIAISFCDPSERALLKAIEKTIRYDIPVDATHPYHGVAAVHAPQDQERRRPPAPRGRSSRPSGGRSTSERSGSGSRNSSERSASKSSGERSIGERSGGRSGEANGNRISEANGTRNNNRSSAKPREENNLSYSQNRKRSGATNQRNKSRWS